jgi:tRNA pseudouridine38-40 synthase
MITRYKLTIEYIGLGYCGFQKQPNLSEKSVEGVLEDAIFQLSKERVKIVACGRTDAGVHAIAQNIHFDLEKIFNPSKMVLGLNNYLRSENVAVTNCEIVDEKFHARFGTKMRHYRYVIINRCAAPVLQRNRAWHLPQNLDLLAMQESAKLLIGEHDFTSFRDSDCQAKSPIRVIRNIEIYRDGEEIIIEVSAKSFLHHMVRNIVGTLSLVGLKRIAAKDMQQILTAKDRTKSGPNAPAYGLYFLRADY